MIVHAVDFARSRVAAVDQDESVELVAQLRIKLAQRTVERTFPHARRPAENYETSILVRVHDLPAR
jgi:hypothetical protein